ncbi:hypothetical protein [Thiofaba sp. EF100]|uniref:hypothetical protein n=1 Tax=Thiofaba sp. EF100 TaxID=3121274 RepID=UPI003221C7A7
MPAFARSQPLAHPSLLGLAGLLLTVLTACQSVASSQFGGAETRLDPRVDEASGLIASPHHAGIYWIHNDSRAFFDSQPTEPLLYAIDIAGRVRGELWVEGLKPYDWEAISAFRWKGRAYLLIGDLGDNRARRTRGIRLDAIEEPGRIEGRWQLKPAWTLRLTYPDGPRDAEAMAVDGTEGAVYILSKRDLPARLYRAPLLAGKGGTRTLEYLGEITAFDAPLTTGMPSELKVLPFTHQPTDMAFAPDGGEVAVLTYAHLYVFPRQAGQSWLEALRGTPKVYDLPGARQYEGLSYSHDGKAWVIVQEGEGSPVLVLPRSKPVN